MSFHFSFTARSDYSARQQLHEAYAPAAVKALVERALVAITWPPPKPPQINVAGAVSSGDEAKAAGASMQASGVGIKGQAPRVHEVCGVLVEVWGHIADGGGANESSEIQRFIVRPLLDFAT